MKRTWKDNLIAKMRKQIKVHKYMKGPMTFCIIVITIAYGSGNYMIQNTKRFASILAIFVFFITSSSFSYINSDDNNIFVVENEWIEIQENYEYEPTIFNISVSEVLDDDDVIEGYDNEELDVAVEDIDQYSLDDILAANEEMSPCKKDNDITVNGAKKLSKDDWKLVLVNKQHPVPDDYTFTLGTIKGTMKCDVRIIDELTEMMQAAKEDGIDLMICSPYRDYNRQTVLFNRKIDYYMEKGYSYLEAYKIASMTVTVPGASEHQIGLALDIVSTKYWTLDIGFGETEAGVWLKQHCDEYGFILRYPAGKEYITGIQYEPWHFRYVGSEAATQIMEKDITLEEFLEELE